MTGERLSALEGIGEATQRQQDRDIEESIDREPIERGSAAPSVPGKGIEAEGLPGRAAEPEPPARDKRLDMELGL